MSLFLILRPWVLLLRARALRSVLVLVVLAVVLALVLVKPAKRTTKEVGDLVVLFGLDLNLGWRPLGLSRPRHYV